MKELEVEEGGIALGFFFVLLLTTLGFLMFGSANHDSAINDFLGYSYYTKDIETYLFKRYVNYIAYTYAIVSFVGVVKFKKFQFLDREMQLLSIPFVLWIFLTPYVLEFFTLLAISMILGIASYELFKKIIF